MSVDENNIVPYIMKTLNNPELAIKLASRNNLPGADDLYLARFNQLFQQGNFAEAAKVAATSPRVNKKCTIFKYYLCVGHFAYTANN